jgi:hypothetical protein
LARLLGVLMGAVLTGRVRRSRLVGVPLLLRLFVLVATLAGRCLAVLLLARGVLR